MKSIVAVAVVAALFGAYIVTSPLADTSEDQFADFIVEYRKSYFSQEEYSLRFDAFKANLGDIEARNADPNQHSTFGINERSDWTEEEWSKLRGYTAFDSQVILENDSSDLPLPQEREFNWQLVGVLLDAKDQGSCGAGWAFAASGAMESAHTILTGYKGQISLSD